MIKLLNFGLIVFGIIVNTNFAFADSVSVVVNGETYSCSKGGGACLCKSPYSDKSSYFVYYGEDRVSQGGYSNLADCIRNMNTATEFKGICR